MSEIWEKYKNLVCNNHESTSQFESSFRILSYIISARSDDSVLSELLYSASNLLVLLNDTILRQTVKLKRPSVKPVSQQRLEQFLTVVEYCEVFLELAAKKLCGESGRWIIIVVIQLVKCALRLLLVVRHKCGLQTSPAMLPLNRVQEIEKKDIDLDLDPFLPSVKETPAVTFTLKRSGRVVRTLDSTPPLSCRSWKLPEQSTEPTSKKQLQLDYIPTPLNKHRLWAEYLHIARPLIHLLSLSQFGLRSWKPWLVSGAVDITSLCLMGDPEDLNPPEKAELRRRCLMLLLYLLRSPFYDRYSKMRIIVLLHIAGAYIPGASYLVGPLMNYLPTWQKIYGYVWAT